MKVVFFEPSLLSDWRNPDAHFLRGVATELLTRDVDVEIHEPADAASVQQLLADHGEKPLDDFRQTFPGLRSDRYPPDTLDLDRLLADADVVVVHHHTEESLVERIGAHRAGGARYLLFFRDGGDAGPFARPSLDGYDGVLHRDAVADNGEGKPPLWAWHDAVDTRLFHPRPHDEPVIDLLLIADWPEPVDRQARFAAQLDEFLFQPRRALGLRAQVSGSRYPVEMLARFQEEGIEHGGWLPDFRLPELLLRSRFVLHLPLSEHDTTPARSLFEALACAVPAVSAPWNDAQKLLTAGDDYLLAASGEETTTQLRALLDDRALPSRLADQGLRTILRRHTCAQRAAELLALVERLRPSVIPETVDLGPS